MQELRLVLIDGDGSGDYDMIGELTVTLGNVMGARAQVWEGQLSYMGNDNRGTILIRSEAIKDSN